MQDQSESSSVPVGIKHRSTLRLNAEAIHQIAWSPIRHVIAVCTADWSIYIWDAEKDEILTKLNGHSEPVYSIAWSRDGRRLASASRDRSIILWDAIAKQNQKELVGHWSPVYSVTWSPDGETLASASWDKTVVLWDAEQGRVRKTLTGHTEAVVSLSWSPDGKILASGSLDDTIKIWDAETGSLLQTLQGHSDSVHSVAWSPNGKILASGSLDLTTRIWNVITGEQTNVLQGHTDYIRCVSFSSDSNLLATKSQDSSVRIWSCRTWETVAVITESINPDNFPGGISFHPSSPVLATCGEEDKVVRLWDYDLKILDDPERLPSTIYYTNAKVVIVGDSGVGKSGLGLVLTGQKFVPTESTHGRHVWTFDSQEVETNGGRKETRETLLWDLAGQPGYRLVHQLSLNEVAAALVVFDARSESDPFAGVRHWRRALRQAQKAQGSAAPPIKTFLVAARTDRGGIGVSRERIEALLRDLEFDGYFETSAKENQNILELAAALREAILWDVLPKVSSTTLFQSIKEFLIAEKEAGRLLCTSDELYRAFLKTEVAPKETSEGGDNLRAQFATCIGRVEARGLIRRLGFGDLVLLQAELLDSYASAIVNAAKQEPDGLGCIVEEEVKAGGFPLSTDERIRDREQERLLLLATIEDMLRHEIALREQAEDGPILVFPSQLTRDNPDLPDPEGKAVLFTFEGPILNVYATLAVRLSRSGLFRRENMWRNAAVYTATVGGTCGLFLREIEEGKGELTLFFSPDAPASEETRFQFEEYVRTHLTRRAQPETITRRRIFVCPECGEPVRDSAAARRRERGLDWLNCPVCEARISLLDREERFTMAFASSVEEKVVEMDRAADEQREQQANRSKVEGKRKTGDFDVFLCHNSADKPAVKETGERLMDRGILPWLDVWELRPGLPWQTVLEEQIESIKSAAVFVGKNGIGPWQNMEQAAFLREFVDRNCPVIPVILPDCEQPPKLPVFLRGMTWADFRKTDPDPLKQLIWGITGKREP